ncbi:hypothetical protein Hanom_Chr11g00974741 [Helianthus anomalus]
MKGRWHFIVSSSLLFFLSFFISTNDSAMSWFDLNYVFGESSGNNTNTFISESTEGSIVLDSYDGRVNDDHATEVVSCFHSYHKEPLLPNQNEVSIHLFTCNRGVGVVSLAKHQSLTNIQSSSAMSSIIIPSLTTIFNSGGHP